MFALILPRALSQRVFFYYFCPFSNQSLASKSVFSIFARFLTNHLPQREFSLLLPLFKLKINSEYDQEIPQSQTADNPVAPRGRAAQPSRDTRKIN